MHPRHSFMSVCHMQRCLAAAFFSLLLCLCLAPPAPAASAVISKNTAFARETLTLINAERQKAGLALLAEDAKLNAAAQKPLKELLRDYTRNKPDSDSITALLKKHGVSSAKTTWCIARGYSSPAAAVAAFKKDKRIIVTKDEYARTGIAVGADNKGKLHYMIIAVIPPDSVRFSGGHAAQKKRILKVINAERRKKGLQVLHYDPGLDAAATIRAKELIKKYGAERPEGSNMMDLVKKNTASLASYTQTYGKSASSPDAFAAGWEKKIAAPKALEKKFTATGIGFAVNKGTLYWCMVNVEPQRLRTLAELTDFRKKVLRLTNAERAKHRLAALKSDAALDKVGDARAGEIIRFYDGGHRRPDKRPWNTILAEYKISWKSCGENIAQGQKTPEAVVAGWMNSPGHRANILNKKFTHLGVGARMMPDGSIYWTQNFVTFSGSAAKTAQKPAAQAVTPNSQKQTSSKATGGTLAAAVQKHLGVKYVWGGTTPQGFDCSGLVYYVCKQYGITLPRTSAEQAKAGRAVAKKNLQPGDLVFFGRSSSGPVDHVGMYIGNDTYVHAPNPDNPVLRTRFSDNSFTRNGRRYVFQGKFTNARRVVK